MKFPWSKPERNTDGGPKTALFSFDRDRERQMAQVHSGGRRDWIDARYVLIDEVLEYRRTGRLTPSLIQACEAERIVASWANSQGFRRLGELMKDGHAAATDRLEELATSSDWRVRYEAFQTLLHYASGKQAARNVVLRALADQSARIRTRLANDAAFAHLIDTASDLEHAASLEPKEEDARSIFWSAWHMRLNQRSGKRDALGGSMAEVTAYERDWAAFQKHCAFRR